MENQTPKPSPTPPTENIPVQNPAVAETPPQVYTAPHIDNPPPKKPFLTGKIILIVIILSVILSAGGTYLALNSKLKPASISTTPTPLPTEASAKAGTLINETANWKTYKNEMYGFSVKYPDKVALREVKKGDNTMVVFDNYSELGYQPGKDSMLGNEIENKSINIEILIETIQDNVSLEQYLDQKYPDRDGDAAKYGLSSFQNRKNEMKSLSIGGEKGLLKETGMAFETISRKAWVKKGSKVFTFSASGSGETGTYVSDVAVKTFDQIISTFKFTEISPTPTCRPRPACLDATPRCLIPETSDMCRPSTIPPPGGGGIVCTQDAKLCPDGKTYVGRQGPNCEFAACPGTP